VKIQASVLSMTLLRMYSLQRATSQGFVILKLTTVRTSNCTCFRRFEILRDSIVVVVVFYSDPEK
jgi:hypothetical protein